MCRNLVWTQIDHTPTLSTSTIPLMATEKGEMMFPNILYLCLSQKLSEETAFQFLNDKHHYIFKIIYAFFFIIFQFDRDTVVYLAVCFVHRNMVCDKRTYMNIDVKKKVVLF